MFKKHQNSWRLGICPRSNWWDGLAAPAVQPHNSSYSTSALSPQGLAAKGR